MYGLILVPMLTFGQTIELPQQYVRDSKLNARITNVKYKGSPYLSEDFVPGKLIVGVKDRFNVSLRYNAYQDEFEMKDAKNNIVAVLKKPDIVVEMQMKTYKLYNFEDKLTYFKELNLNGKASLLKKESKKFIKAKEAENSYSSGKSAKFVLKRGYYINVANSINKIKLNKKALLNELRDKEDDLTKFIKLNKLKLKSEDEVILLLDYYNSLE